MMMGLPAVLAAVSFFAWGVAAERIAARWPERDASGRPPGYRSVLLGVGAAAAAGALAWRSQLPLWATLVYLGFLALLVLLAATDLEQRLLPHAALDPLILGALLFVPFNPAVSWQSALAAGAGAVACLGLLGLAIRGGIALGDLYLAAPLGLLLGLPATFVALLAASLLAGVASAVLVPSGRVRLKSYIPFAPFLVAAALIALLTGPELPTPLA